MLGNRMNVYSNFHFLPCEMLGKICEHDVSYFRDLNIVADGCVYFFACKEIQVQGEYKCAMANDTLGTPTVPSK